MTTVDEVLKRELNSTEKVLQQLLKPEFHLRDVVQVVVGATILAMPVAFTEEVWDLGNELPWLNIFLVVLISLSFISVFVYYNYYKNTFRKNWVNFLKRVGFTYLLSMLIVALMLSLIQKVDWVNMLDISLKRVFLIAFPASMSAVVADIIK